MIFWVFLTIVYMITDEQILFLMVVANKFGLKKLPLTLSYRYWLQFFIFIVMQVQKFTYLFI